MLKRGKGPLRHYRVGIVWWRVGRALVVVGLGGAFPRKQAGDFPGLDFRIGHMATGQATHVEALEVAADLAVPATADAGLKYHVVLMEHISGGDGLAHGTESPVQNLVYSTP
jgi:hypothetical protein